MTPTVETKQAPSPELGLTMTHVLRNPLAALRASMESLACGYSEQDPRAQQLRGALEQVLKMSRDVDALVQLTAPRPLAPLECTVEEILRAALRGMRFDFTGRVKLADASAGATLMVDGPLLADCLHRLLESALSSCGEIVLLSARVEGAAVHFAIVESGDDRSLRGFKHTDLPTARAAALELGLALARRDLERIGGSLQITHTLLANTCINVRIPSTPPASA